MNIFLQTFFILVTTAVFVQPQNYCNPDLCPKGTHIACGNSGKFAATCPSNARIIPLSTAMKNLILQMHNVRKNRVAGGNLPGFSQASRMTAVTWDDELARMALLNSKTCVMKHDTCRNTPRFLRSGQNIGTTSASGTATNPLRRHLIKTIQNWFIEYRDANMGVINSFRNLARPIGHFTAMINDRTTKIGCATVEFTRNGRNTKLTNCNYASTNIFDKTVYTAGPTASRCTTGRHATYRNLCSASENVNPNQV